MKKILSFLLFSGFAFLVACSGQQNNEKKKPKQAKPKPVTAKKKTDVDEGLHILKAKCYMCHSPSASEKAGLAPPMAAVKKHYITDQNATEADFLKVFKEYMLQPSEEKSIIPNAIKRYGVMAKVPLTDTEIDQLAKAIYRTDLPKPGWYQE